MFTKRRLTLFVTLLIVFAMTSIAFADLKQEATAAFQAYHPNSNVQISGDKMLVIHALGFSAQAFNVNDDIVENAGSFLRENEYLTGTQAAALDLEFDKLTNYKNAGIVRFRQTMWGRPVFGTTAAVCVESDGSITRIAANLVTEAEKWRKPKLGVDQIAALTVSRIPQGEALPKITLGYLLIGKKSVLVYEVPVMAPGPHLFVNYVHADSGVIIGAFDAVKDAHEAMVYIEDPITTPDLISVSLDLFPTDGDHIYHTYGDYTRTATCTNFEESGYACVAWEHTAIATDVDGFLNILPTTSPGSFSEIMAYYAINDLRRWFRDEMGFDGKWGDYEHYMSTGETVMRDHIWVLVNAEYGNGHFRGGSDYGMADVIVLGLTKKNLAWDNDIVRHEFGHAISNRVFEIGWINMDDYGIDMTASGIEEGAADYWAATTVDNSVIGEYVSLNRDIDNNNRCPDDLVGESHGDGLIVSGAMWDIREELGKKKADHLMYVSFVGSDTINSFADWARNLISAAQILETSEDDALLMTAEETLFVESVLVERNIIDCKRVIPLIEGDNPKLHYAVLNYLSAGTPSSVQWMTTTGVDTEILDLHIRVSGDSHFDVLIREGEPVEFEWIYNDDEPIWQAEYDMLVEYNGLIPTSLVRLSDITELQLKKNTEYFYSIICAATKGACINRLSVQTSTVPEGSDSDNDGGVQVDTDTNVDTDTEIDTDADNTLEEAGGENDDGCGCSQAIGRFPVAWSIMGLLL